MAYFILTQMLLARPDGSGAGAHRQYRFRRASRPAARLRRPAERARLSRADRLRPLQARQHPVHARTGAAACRHRRDRQLPASRICRDQFRPAQQWSVRRRRVRFAMLFAKPPGAGRGDHRLSGELIRRSPASAANISTRQQTRASQPQAQNDETARRLWDESAPDCRRRSAAERARRITSAARRPPSPG